MSNNFNDGCTVTPEMLGCGNFPKTSMKALGYRQAQPAEAFWGDLN